MRATGSHTVVLDEVFVPDAAVVAGPPRRPVAPGLEHRGRRGDAADHVGVPRRRRRRGRADARRRRRAPRRPRPPAGRRDAERPHHGVRRRRRHVPGQRQPAVRQHRRARQPDAEPQDGGLRRLDRHRPPRHRGDRRARATPAAPTSSGSTATSTAASSTRSPGPSRPSSPAGWHSASARSDPSRSGRAVRSAPWTGEGVDEPRPLAFELVRQVRCASRRGPERADRGWPRCRRRVPASAPSPAAGGSATATYPPPDGMEAASAKAASIRSTVVRVDLGAQPFEQLPQLGVVVMEGLALVSDAGPHGAQHLGRR